MCGPLVDDGRCASEVERVILGYSIFDVNDGDIA